MANYDPDDERDDPRELAARIRSSRSLGAASDLDEYDTVDPDTDDPRELARLIHAARGTGRTHRR